MQNTFTFTKQEIHNLFASEGVSAFGMAILDKIMERALLNEGFSLRSALHAVESFLARNEKISAIKELRAQSCNAPIRDGLKARGYSDFSSSGFGSLALWDAKRAVEDMQAGKFPW